MISFPLESLCQKPMVSLAFAHYARLNGGFNDVWNAPVPIVVLPVYVIVKKTLTQYCYECLQVNGTEIGWSLGFMIESSSELPQSKREYYMTNLAFALMMTLFILFILISVGFACHAVKFQRRKQKGKLYQTAPKSDGYGAIQWTSKEIDNVQWNNLLPPEVVHVKNKIC